jgi:hypothetical protein
MNENNEWNEIKDGSQKYFFKFFHYFHYFHFLL